MASLICVLLLLHGFQRGIGSQELDDAESLIHSSVASHKVKPSHVDRSAEARVDGSPKRRTAAHAESSHREFSSEEALRRNATCEAVLAGEIRVDSELSAAEWHEYGEQAMCTRRKHFVSRFGSAVPKVPTAYIQRIKELDHSKRHQYNFQGSMDFQHPSRKEQRYWIFPFAERHFHSGDVLRLTDANPSYVPLGPYDLSLVPKPVDENESAGHRFFDTRYFGTLAASNFTLCPSGDHGWSIRVWEAAVAGSICVIRSLALDVNANDVLCRIPYKFYTTNSSLKYSQEVADYNYRMFIKYQTFLEGDNVPPLGCNGRVVE